MVIFSKLSQMIDQTNIQTYQRAFKMPIIIALVYANSITILEREIQIHDKGCIHSQIPVPTDF